MKKQKFEYSEQQSLDMCIRQLEALLEGLKAGSVTLSQSEHKLWLRPGAAVDLELCAEQSGDSERLEVRLGWRRRSLHVVSRPSDDAPPQTVRNWQPIPGSRDAAPPEEETAGAASLPGNLDRSAMEHYQALYAAARRSSGGGQHRLDEARFMHSLEEAGVEPRTRQELYNLALRAEADGRASLFEPNRLAARRKAS